MSSLSSAQAEEALIHLTHQFAQWRQSRRTPRGRIPPELWTQAVALTTTLSVTRVARQLGLTSHTLKRRRTAVLNGTPPPLPAPQRLQFVEVAPSWRTPATEVEIHRPDGTRLRITYSEAAPALAPLLQTFLASH
jgi:transposase-like protein